MDCARFDELVDLLAAGELEPGAAAEAERHAAACAECAGRLDAARARLQTLAAGLGTLKASDGFVDRVMAGVRAEAERAAKAAENPPRERWRAGILRYAAYAAAAALFVMAGYTFFQHPDTGRYLSGKAVGEDAKEIPVGARLVPGRPIITPVSTNQPSRIDLDEGRLQAALAPGSLFRLADPGAGVLGTLDKGDLFWRAGAKASAAFATPLAIIQAGPGEFSIHVVPTPGEGEPGHFAGQVTIVSRSGRALVRLPGQDQAPLAVGPGQVLTLRSDRPRPATQPLPFEAVEENLQGQIRELEASRGNFERLYRQLSEDIRVAPFQEQGELCRRAVGYQDAIRQAQQAASERARLLDMVRRAHEQGQHIFQVVLPQAPNEP